jgi:hypothetical protein
VSHVEVALEQCPNCGRALDGAFCAACGQKVGPINPTFHDLLHDLTHEFLHVDGKIFRSVRLLLTRPGFLSREYFEGRRARYISPIRLYLIFSVLFFLVSAALSTPLSEQDKAELSNVPGRVNRIGDPDVTQRLDTWLPRVMFVLVPVAAVLTSLVTRGAQRNYPQHLYFTLHTHAAVFAIMAIFMLVRYGQSDVRDAIADLMGLTLVPAYIVVAFRTAYGGSWRRAIGRAALAGLLYAIAVLLAVVGLTLAAIYL